MKSILLLAACAIAAVLTGCAGPETAVRARSAQDFGQGERTYAFVQSPEGAVAGDDTRFTSSIARRLAELGFVAAPETSAHYRVALSHETRPASVSIDYAACAGGAPCGAADTGRTPGFPWPGATAYVHSLTLRFFDRTDGTEAYRVSATKRDRELDAGQAAGYLVAGALARLPFAGAAEHGGNAQTASESERRGDWKVTLHAPEGGADTPPRVTGVSTLHE